MEIGLQKLIGRRILVMGPMYLDGAQPASVKLLGVEDAGIWIESQEAEAHILGGMKKKASVDNLAFFVPFSQITTIVAGYEPE